MQNENKVVSQQLSYTHFQPEDFVSENFSKNIEKNTNVYDLTCLTAISNSLALAYSSSNIFGTDADKMEEYLKLQVLILFKMLFKSINQ